MSRPKVFDREVAVQQVMDYMWQHGFEACSVQAMSNLLGITRSSFYNAFNSRETLFKEALGQYMATIPRASLGQLQQHPSASVLQALTKELQDVCKLRTDDHLARGCFGVNSIIELVGRHQELGSMLEGAIKMSAQRFEKMLQLAQARGEIEAGDLHTKAMALQNVVLGINIMSKAIRDEAELWSIAKLNLQGLGLYRT